MKKTIEEKKRETALELVKEYLNVTNPSDYEFLIKKLANENYEVDAFKNELTNTLTYCFEVDVKNHKIIKEIKDIDIF